MTQRVARLRAVCKGCNTSFTPKTRKQKYCTDTCREKYYEEHYFIKTVVSKTCPNCDTVFSTSKPKRQIYCKPKCREDARKKRMEGLSASVEAERVTYLGERMAAFERDEFKCTVCGKGTKDGAILDIIEEGTSLVTVCTECKTGKEKHAHGTGN